MSFLHHHHQTEFISPKGRKRFFSKEKKKNEAAEHFHLRLCFSFIRIIRKCLAAEQSPVLSIRRGVIRFIRLILQAVEGGERTD